MTTEETDCNTKVLQGSVEQRGVCMGQGYRAAGGQMGRHLGGLPEGGNKLSLKDKKILHDGPCVSSGSGFEPVVLVSGDGGMN